MTIKEFARAVGVSTTTVSRTVSGQGRISPATREMVLRRMDELGYTPNLNAQRLAAGRAYTVALAFGGTQVLSDMFLTELTQGIQNALHVRGYGLLLNAPGNTLQRWVKSQAVDGVIVVGCGPLGMNLLGDEAQDERIAREIADMKAPCVVIGHDPVTRIEGVGSVVIDLRSGARQVAQMLMIQGHSCIGFIGSHLPDSVLSGFWDELTVNGIRLREEQVIIAGRTPDDGAHALRTLLAQPEPPTAIFARTDALAVGALRAARKLNVRVPEDLSVIGHDDVSFAGLTEPPLTTVRVDCAQLGRAATEMLFHLLDKPDVPFSPQVVHTELVARETVAPMRHSKFPE